MDYITPKEAGVMWGISERRVQVLCTNGRVEGAERLGGKMWVIPKGTPKPIDGRTRTSMQVKSDKSGGDIKNGETTGSL